jgi:GT2 family glycosyltransferase
MSREISVIVCTSTLRRWNELCECVSALPAQTLAAHQILEVVDHEPALLDRVADELQDAVALPSDGPPGLAGCRNTGARAAKGSIVAFIDDDALAETDWLERLASRTRTWWRSAEPPSQAGRRRGRPGFHPSSTGSWAAATAGFPRRLHPGAT